MADEIVEVVIGFEITCRRARRCHHMTGPPWADASRRNATAPLPRGRRAREFDLIDEHRDAARDFTVMI
jgi:hypothetical protein